MYQLHVVFFFFFLSHESLLVFLVVFFNLFFFVKCGKLLNFIGTRVKIDLAKIEQKHSASRQARTATRKKRE